MDCKLRVNPLAIIGGKLSGTGAGNGRASIKVPIPAGATVKDLAYQAASGTGADFTMSNVRIMTIK